MIWILVGTETGNSLDFAERASDDLQRFGIPNDIVLMDDLPLESFLQECETVLFICSTTGDGDVPLCMRSFMKFILRSDLPNDLLEGMRFGVFGLGDSTYEKFNFAGKRLWRRMPQLGAEPLVPFRGEGDEQHPQGGLEHGWEHWWGEVRRQLTQGKTELPAGRLEPKHRLNVNSDRLSSAKSPSASYPVKVVSNERMTPESHFQDTRLINVSVKASDKEFNFQPGDIIALLPDNDPALVDELFEILGVDGGACVYGVKSSSRSAWTCEPVPFPLTLHDFFVRFVDISASPSRTCCRRLAQYVNVAATAYSGLHREKLLELAADESEYLDYVWRPQRTVLEVLRDFMPSIRIPLGDLLHVFRPLRRRQFSIASAPKFVNGQWELELCVALIEYALPGGRGRREGVISRCFRTNQLLNDTAQILKGSWDMRCLAVVERVLLFATGTGIAPIRHLIQFVREQSFGADIILFFGCRSLEADFYFAQEWDALGVKVFSAGSRDAPGKKVYLDSVIERESDLLGGFNPSHCACFVAGHTRLGKLVSNSLASIWGAEAVDRLKAAGRFQTETWS